MEAVLWASCSYDTPEHVFKKKNVMYHALVKPEGGNNLVYTSKHKLKTCLWILCKVYRYTKLYGSMFVKPEPNV
jgi:hypothetical protein